MREGLSFTVWIIHCEGLSLATGLNKFFLQYLATIVLDIVCSKQIYSLTIFVHRLAEDESHRYHFIVIILFVSMRL
jgi:hypothetical protein